MLQCLKNAIPIESCALSERALHYGDGCFSTIRVVQDLYLLKTRHWARLKFAAERLNLQVDFALIQRSISQLKAQNSSPIHGVVKILISRGVGGRGYSMPDQPADIYLYYYPAAYACQEPSIPVPEQIETGMLQQQIGLSMPSLVGVKSLNRLEQVMLKHEADQQGWAEALVSDVQNHIVEGVSSNCFIRINDAWITPELRYNGVHGVMRAEILARMQQHQLHCTHAVIDRQDIDQIQSLFFCNALTPMKIVHRLNRRTLAVQPCVELFETLQLDHLTSYVENNV